MMTMNLIQYIYFQHDSSILENLIPDLVENDVIDFKKHIVDLVSKLPQKINHDGEQKTYIKEKDEFDAFYSQIILEMLNHLFIEISPLY